MATDIFTVESGALPGATRVAAFEGTERLSTAYELTAWLLVPGADAMALDPDAVLLRPGTLRVLRDDASPRLGISGVWSSLELVHEAPGGDALYRAVLVPTWWKLKLSRHSRVWVDKTIPQVIEDVFRKAALPAARYALRLSGRYEPRPHVCQYRESDFDFVSRWMEREGIYYFFEHSDDGEKMVLTDDKARHQPWEDGTVDFVPETAAGDSGREGFRAFTQREVYLKREVRVRDHDVLNPRRALTGETSVQGAHQGVEVRHAEDGSTNNGLAGRAASLRADQETASRSTYRGSGRVFGVRVGYRFAVSGHPRASLDQDYLCTAVRHRGRLLPGEHELAEFLPMPDHRVYIAEVEATLASVQFRAPVKTPRPTAPNLEIARVDGPANSDYAQIDDHGRYRVRMLFDENDTRAGEASTWVRMLQPHAGAPEGWHFPLRKGTEVMVTFLGGDPDRPLITGAVPDADRPAAVVEANHTHNVIHTGGNSRVEIEDSAGAQYVDISTPPENTFIHLGALHGAHDHNYISSTDGNGLIHTGGTLDVTVGGQKHEHVQGTVTETYSSTQTTDVTADVTENYRSNMTTTVTAHVQENYKSHTTNVATKTVERCASQVTAVSAHLEEKHKEQHSTIGGRLYVKSGTHEETTSGTHQAEYGTLLITVKGTFTLTSAGPIRITALNWQDNAPITYTMVTNVRRQIANASKAVVKPLFIELIGSKESHGTFSLSLGNTKAELNGAAIAANGFKFDYTVGKVERIGIKIKPIPIKLEGKPFKSSKFAFTLFG